MNFHPVDYLISTSVSYERDIFGEMLPSCGNCEKNCVISKYVYSALWEAEQ